MVYRGPVQLADGYGVGKDYAASRDIPREAPVELADGPLRGFVYALFFEAVFVAAVYLLVWLIRLL